MMIVRKQEQQWATIRGRRVPMRQATARKPGRVNYVDAGKVAARRDAAAGKTRGAAKEARLRAQKYRQESESASDLRDRKDAEGMEILWTSYADQMDRLMNSPKGKVVKFTVIGPGIEVRNAIIKQASEGETTLHREDLEGPRPPKTGIVEAPTTCPLCGKKHKTKGGAMVCARNHKTWERG